MIALRKRVEQMEGVDGELLDRFDACALALARNQLNEGVACLTGITRALISLTTIEYQRGILVHCAEGMEIHGTERIEFPVLTLHTLAAG